MDQGREITIVLRVQGRGASGTWQSSRNGEKRDIAVSGVSRDIPWEAGLWEKLRANIQLNQDADRCRILVISDRLLGEEELPVLRNGWQWTLETVSRTLPEDVKRSARAWFLNGEGLGTRFQSLFPQAGGDAPGTVYLHTAPPLPPPPVGGSGASLGRIFHETLTDRTEASGDSGGK